MSTQLSLRAHFTCINPECRRTYELDEIVYQCESCGDLLEVTHDLQELGKLSGEDWKSVFDSRLGSQTFPYQSGIWNKWEWVLPALDHENVISSGEGNTHLFHSQRWAKDLGIGDLYIKQCGISHTGSFKDLGMTVLVSQVHQMRKKGIPIRAVACASTGDTSAALASYAAKAGIPTVVFLPANKVSTAQLIQPVSNGAHVLSLDTDFDGCMKIVQEVSKDKSIYLANSMNSLRVEGQKTISIEILQQLRWKVPDWVIIPGGNLGNVSALGNGFLMMKQLGLIERIPRICLAQAQNANPLYRSFQTGFESFSPIEAKKTLASAIQIGNPVSVKKAIKILQLVDGVVEEATEEELSNAAAEGDLYGLYNDPHTGVALAALQKMISKKWVQKHHSVVVISTANGLKFTEFKTQFHEGGIPGVLPRFQNKIHLCDAKIDTVFERLSEILR